MLEHNQEIMFRNYINSMIEKILLYVHTIRYLKPIQFWYRFYYFILIKTQKKPNLFHSLNKEHHFLTYTFTYSNNSYKGILSFNFLNIIHSFKNSIDWEIKDYGKLWQYNLTYFNFLTSDKISEEEGISLINSFLSWTSISKLSLEPYPTSLRIMNWIRFISSRNIKNQEIVDSIHHQTVYLINRLEYHILGNHLLENIFALLHSALFFKDEKLYQKSEKLLKQQLNEQILPDGAHFELSPMYHQLMLYRVLECIDILKNSGNKKQLLSFLTEKASNMLGWLSNLTFKNGDIPLFNDSAFEIAPTTKLLKNFAALLNIDCYNNSLETSGYRKFDYSNYECIIDIGNIAANYQPGHTHADIFNFVLYYNRKPYIVDTGTSTYQVNERRQVERSTESHNTIVINKRNQSEVWGGFRVAKRAKVKLISNTNREVIAEHSGYNVLHQRHFSFEKSIKVHDRIKGKNYQGEAFIHFHPDIKVEISNNEVLTSYGSLKIRYAKKIRLDNYNYAPQFNYLINAQKVIIEFYRELEIEILFN